MAKPNPNLIVSRSALDEIKADALRYRFLREKFEGLTIGDLTTWGCSFKSPKSHCIDAAIDYQIDDTDPEAREAIDAEIHP